MPPAALTLEDTGAVTSTVQRLVEAVSYRCSLSALLCLANSDSFLNSCFWKCRAASEAQPSLIEQMEAKQVGLCSIHLCKHTCALWVSSLFGDLASHVIHSRLANTRQRVKQDPACMVH